MPHVLDSPEWGEMLTLLNDHVRPTASTTYTTKIIPQEAVFVREKMQDLLRKEFNLTLSFDGGSTRHPESFYTAHVTTPERKSFFLHGHTGSSDSHNAKRITDRLMKVTTT